MTAKPHCRRIARALPALALILMLAIPAGNAFAASTNIKDELTVSGRFDLPKAKQSLHQTLDVNSMLEIDEETRKTVSKIMKIKMEELDPLLLGAFKKSLANYGYLSPTVTSEEISAGEIITRDNDLSSAITVKISAVDFEEQGDDVLSTVSLSIDGPNACLKAETKANFLALKRKDTQKGRKVFAFLGAVALNSLANSNNPKLDDSLYQVTFYPDYTYGGFFLHGELDEAALLNKVHIYGQNTAIGEGYPPKNGKRTAKRHAMKNAIRLNFARYITVISQACN